MPLKDELVPKPRQKLPNVSSEILEKTTFFEGFERFCCLRLLAVKQLRKNQLPGENTMPLKDELVPKPRQKTQRVVWNPGKTTFFERFCCLRLLAVKQLRKNQLPGENTMPLKDELVPKPRQKFPNVSSEILEKQHFSRDFSRDSVACGC